MRRQRLSGFEEQLTDPASLAITRVRRTLSPYDKDDVQYTPTIEEDVERYTAATDAKVRKLYEDYLGSRTGELAIVGDFDLAENLNVLRQAFTGWTTKEPYERIPRKVFPGISGGTQQIVTPDKANAVYIAGLVFPMKDTDPDYPSLVIGNFVFGGGSLSSRLGDRVRQKEGLSYGVGSFISSDALDPRTSLTINAICNPDNIQKVNTAIAEELARLLADGVTPEELARAKQGYLQQQQVTRSSDAALAAMLADDLYLDRTMAYDAEVEAKIAAATPAQVVAVLRKYIDPKRLVIVDAGDFSAQTTARKP